MKKLILSFLLLIIASSLLKAQPKEPLTASISNNDKASEITTTIILMRHAEKDTAHAMAMMKSDPPLAKAGLERALRLPEILKLYSPDIFYSTPLTRTKATLQPWAEILNKEIKTYNGNDLASFAHLLKTYKGQTIVVAGHSNTTPALVNLLLAQKKYTDMADDEYNKYWIITIKDNGIIDKVVTY